MKNIIIAIKKYNKTIILVNHNCDVLRVISFLTSPNMINPNKGFIACKINEGIAAEGLCHTPFFRETKNISVQYIIKVIVIFVTAKKKKNCAFCLLAYNGNTIIEIANNQLLIIVKVVP
jgi:hypothetical protein